jgi:hypothetical protein
MLTVTSREGHEMTIGWNTNFEIHFSSFGGWHFPREWHFGGTFRFNSEWIRSMIILSLCTHLDRRRWPALQWPSTLGVPASSPKRWPSDRPPSSPVPVDETISTALAECPFSSVQELSRGSRLPRCTVHQHLTQSLRFTIRHLRCVPTFWLSNRSRSE